MDPELDEAPELSEYYRITDAGDAWHLDCLKCKKRFSLLKADHAIGSRLALLNHAGSHQGQAGKGVDRA